jgi:hypothetical protein
MIDEKDFFVDLVNAIPANTNWSLQSSFPELYEAMMGIPFFRESTNIELTFKDEFRDQLATLAKNNRYEYINFLQVFQNGKKILEAFDGFVIVTISKGFSIKGASLSKYLDKDLLYISDDW